MPLQDRQLDFEDFSSDAEKLSAILKRTEVSSARHKLCREYCRARKFALLCPSVLSCTAIGILGFVVTTDAVKAHMKVGDVQVEDVLTLVVGFLGFAVGTLLLLMNQWDFGGREAMHLSAMTELDDLGSRVRYNRMDRRVGVSGGGGGGADGDGYGDEKNDDDHHHNASSNPSFFGGGGGAPKRKALGVVEAPDTGRIALVVAGGKKLEEMENEIKKRTNAARWSENSRNDVSR
jgi:hypothetical protein